MKFHLIPLILMGLLCKDGAFFGQPSGDQASSAHSKIQFTIENAGLDVTGAMNVIDTAIDFNPDALGTSVINATADPATIKTGIGIRDAHLARRDYFDVSHHKQIRLRSLSFRKNGRNAFKGIFILEIKGISREVVIPFTVSHKNETTIYRGNFTMNRLEFMLGEKSPILDDEVDITLEAVVKR